LALKIHVYQHTAQGGWLAVYPFSLEPEKGGDATVEIARSAEDIVSLVRATADSFDWASYELIFHVGHTHLKLSDPS
jgi:hypothetical protein